ncbi:hypothetical protein THIOSC15_1730009 [uncultured Thiomicrorhabdus sp.]
MLFTPPKYSDEVLSDYIDRLAFYNGFSSRNKFIRSISQNTRLQGYNKTHKSLMLLTSNSIDFKEPIGRGKNKKHKVRMCSKCFCEDRYIRFFWEFYEYKNCHIHRIPLIEVNSFTYDICLVCSEKENCRVTSGKNFYEKTIEYAQPLSSDFISFNSIVNNEVNSKKIAMFFINFLKVFFSKNFNEILETKKIKYQVSSGRFIGLGIHKIITSITKYLAKGDFEREQFMVFILTLMVQNRGLKINNRVVESIDLLIDFSYKNLNVLHSWSREYFDKIKNDYKPSCNCEKGGFDLNEFLKNKYPYSRGLKSEVFNVLLIILEKRVFN